MCSKCKICATFEVNLMESVTFETFSTIKQKVLKHFVVYVNRMCKISGKIMRLNRLLTGPLISSSGSRGPPKGLLDPLRGLSAL